MPAGSSDVLAGSSPPTEGICLGGFVLAAPLAEATLVRSSLPQPIRRAVSKQTRAIQGLVRSIREPMALEAQPQLAGRLRIHQMDVPHDADVRREEHRRLGLADRLAVVALRLDPDGRHRG